MSGALKPQEKSKLMLKHNNVAGGRLSRFADGVGFNRDGYCRVTDDDSGNHSIAATVTKSFLDFTNSRGNNLQKLQDGQKWCLCASRWKEAYDAWQDGQLGENGVPKVALHASDAKALDVVEYKQLKKFGAEGEVAGAHGRQGGTIEPSSGGSGAVKEGDISGTRPGSDQQYGKTKNTQNNEPAKSGSYS